MEVIHINQWIVVRNMLSALLDDDHRSEFNIQTTSLERSLNFTAPELFESQYHIMRLLNAFRVYCETTNITPEKWPDTLHVYLTETLKLTHVK